jgi:hypothetical protein
MTNNVFTANNSATATSNAAKFLQPARSPCRSASTRMISRIIGQSGLVNGLCLMQPRSRRALGAGKRHCSRSVADAASQRRTFALPKASYLSFVALASASQIHPSPPPIKNTPGCLVRNPLEGLLVKGAGDCRTWTARRGKGRKRHGLTAEILRSQITTLKRFPKP